MSFMDERDYAEESANRAELEREGREELMAERGGVLPEGALLPEGADFMWTYRTGRDDGFGYAVGTSVGGVSDRGAHALFATREALDLYVGAWLGVHPDAYVLHGAGLA